MRKLPASLLAATFQLFRGIGGSLFTSKANLNRGKRAGTQQSKSRLGSHNGQHVSSVQRRRRRKQITKQLQRTRRRRGTNQRTG